MNTADGPLDWTAFWQEDGNFFSCKLVLSDEGMVHKHTLSSGVQQDRDSLSVKFPGTGLKLSLGYQ